MEIELHQLRGSSKSEGRIPEGRKKAEIRRPKKR
jgi:hypothetical protein